MPVVCVNASIITIDLSSTSTEAQSYKVRSVDLRVINDWIFVVMTMMMMMNWVNLMMMRMSRWA